MAELKETDGRDLLIQGSSTLYVPLLAAGLIDQLVLMTFPVLLGEGKRIFDGSEKPGALKLVENFVSDNGRRLCHLRARRRGADRHVRNQAAERGRDRAAQDMGERRGVRWNI